MRLVVRQNVLRRALLWTQLALLISAVALLGYGGFALADAWLFQRRESSGFERQLEQSRALGQTSEVPAVPTARTGPQKGLLGRLEIQRLGLSVMVVEGADRRTLRRAVGHIPGTALPGQNGNMALTGHRDTFFRPLRNIRQDDTITLTTLQGQYRYRVRSIQVVSPDNVSVLDSSQNEILTLITCHPFYFVGAAPDRFIVRAERIQ
jgi:sortase A